ncbi:hypothetical protein BJ165DRAFT_789789 [Panaeolus papilionaceus]|nr:hypothetical protein BJ165DRAFT_789789 [Panaeolus papilionaceus]
MHTSEYDYLFKLLLIGDSGVGKVIISSIFLFSTINSPTPCSPVYFYDSQTTHTQRAILVLSVLTSRFALLN